MTKIVHKQLALLAISERNLTAAFCGRVSRNPCPTQRASVNATGSS